MTPNDPSDVRSPADRVPDVEAAAIWPDRNDLMVQTLTFVDILTGAEEG